MRTALVLLLVMVAMAVPVRAQDGAPTLGRGGRLYGGVGIGDGVGLVAVGSSPLLDVFTRDVALYAAVRPGADDDAARLVVAVGIGGSLRLLRVRSVTVTRTPPTMDLDVGLRVGPSFSLALGRQSEASRARAFSVAADPFVRLTRRVGRRVAFAEIGPQSPVLRAGLSLALPEPSRRR